MVRPEWSRGCTSCLCQWSNEWDHRRTIHFPLRRSEDSASIVDNVDALTYIGLDTPAQAHGPDRGLFITVCGHWTSDGEDRSCVWTDDCLL